MNKHALQRLCQGTLVTVLGTSMGCAWAQAEQNRISFGRTKAEKQLTRSMNEKADKTHRDGRLETDDDGA